MATFEAIICGLVMFSALALGQIAYVAYRVLHILKRQEERRGEAGDNSILGWKIGLG